MPGTCSVGALQVGCRGWGWGSLSVLDCVSYNKLLYRVENGKMFECMYIDNTCFMHN